MRWFDVKFSGWGSFDGGQEHTFRATVRATDPKQAVQKVVGAKFGLDYWRVTHDYSNIGRMLFAIEDGRRFYETIRTSYRALAEIVTEVTDGARLARLTGAPELSFLEGEGAAGEAREAAPSPLPPRRFFRVTLTGKTADGRPVRLASTYRAGAAMKALARGMEEVFSVPPKEGNWVTPYPATGKIGALSLETEGRSWILKLEEAVKMWDIVEEVNPPSWASLWPAPDAFQAQCLKTWGSAADTPREQRLHALLGLAGEVGEVANLVKKQLYKPGVVADNTAVIDELADVAYYLAVLASLYGVTFDGLFAHLAGKLAGGHGWLNPSNSTGLEGGA